MGTAAPGLGGFIYTHRRAPPARAAAGLPPPRGFRRGQGPFAGRKPRGVGGRGTAVSINKTCVKTPAAVPLQHEKPAGARRKKTLKVAAGTWVVKRLAGDLQGFGYGRA